MIKYLGALLFLLAGCNTSAIADEYTICYNYGCAVKAEVHLSAKALSQIEQLFYKLPDAEAERESIAEAIGLFEFFSGTQTPTYQDKGENLNDNGVDGRMDCIDHSTNTTTYLNLLSEKSFLKFHKVMPRAKRAPMLFNEHWTAVIEETATHHDYAVDSWFFDNGHPAAILDLDKWKSGASPDA